MFCARPRSAANSTDEARVNQRRSSIRFHRSEHVRASSCYRTWEPGRSPSCANSLPGGFRRRRECRDRARHIPPTARDAPFDASLRSGGSGEIRTHERFPFAGFQDRCNRPLCHASLICLDCHDAAHILAVDVQISQHQSCEHVDKNPKNLIEHGAWR